MRQEFHDHLDICAQCRNHPMHLCEVGVAALHSTVLSLSEERTTSADSAEILSSERSTPVRPRDNESSSSSADLATLRASLITLRDKWRAKLEDLRNMHLKPQAAIYDLHAAELDALIRDTPPEQP